MIGPKERKTDRCRPKEGAKQNLKGEVGGTKTKTCAAKLENKDRGVDKEARRGRPSTTWGQWSINVGPGKARWQTHYKRKPKRSEILRPKQRGQEKRGEKGMPRVPRHEYDKQKYVSQSILQELKIRVC